MRKPSSKSRSSHRWLLKDFKNGGHEFFEERFSRDVTPLANQRVNTVILTYWYRLNTLGNSAEYLVKKKCIRDPGTTSGKASSFYQVPVEDKHTESDLRGYRCALTNLPVYQSNVILPRVEV